jgi:hypothetical protein
MAPPYTTKVSGSAAGVFRDEQPNRSEQVSELGSENVRRIGNAFHGAGRLQLDEQATLHTDNETLETAEKPPVRPLPCQALEEDAALTPRHRELSSRVVDDANASRPPRTAARLGAPGSRGRRGSAPRKDAGRTPRERPSEQVQRRIGPEHLMATCIPASGAPGGGEVGARNTSSIPRASRLRDCIRPAACASESRAGEGAEDNGKVEIDPSLHDLRRDDPERTVSRSASLTPERTLERCAGHMLPDR